MPIDGKISVGLIGLGSFGSKIREVLKGNDSFKLVYEGTHDFATSPKCDWVIIATPVLTHNEICHWFLDRESNVLITKPGSTSKSGLVELINHAKSSGLSLYVDDVFRYSTMFEKIFEITKRYEGLDESVLIQAKWLKNGPFDDSLGNALAYHHFYMLSAFNHGAEISEIEIQLNKLNKKSFTARSGNYLFRSDLDRSAEKVLHQLKINGLVFETLSNDKNLALKKMVSSVLTGTTDLALNHKIAISAQKATDALNFMKPKCAVIGGGIFGTVIAAEMIDVGLETHLFESSNQLLSAASGINQYRLHRGYHYPRSIETATEVKKESISFLKSFPVALKPKKSMYAIASLGSQLTANEYESFLRNAGLEYEIISNSMFNPGVVERTFEVNESLFDPDYLRNLVEVKLNEKRVKLHLSHQATENDIAAYDYVVVATYAQLNQLTGTETRQNYQFELCEKPVVKLSDKFQGISLVVMDGEFFCLDPLGTSKFHVLGNVRHAIHSSNIGISPEIPDKYVKFLNRGLIPPSEIMDLTNIHKFLEQINLFLSDPGEIVHIGSMFTIRTVLPRREHDDARPTVITKHSEKLYSVFSGKIVAAVDTAQSLSSMIRLE